MIRIRKWALVLGIVIFLLPFLPTSPSAAAQTPDYEMTSVSGIWTVVDGGSYTVTGVGTNQVNWGISTGYGKSGLRFDGTGSQSFNEGNIFLLGTLTHLNWPVQSPAATGATLQITLVFDTPSITPNPSFSFDFEIEETTNQRFYWQCPDWQQTSTPCDDRITFPSSYGTETFQIGDKSYTLEIIGFVNTYPGSTPVDEFITEEAKDNSAFLVGKLSSVLVPEPAVMITKKTNDINVESAPGPELVAGDTVTWQYVVQNSGNVELTNITVTDNVIGTITCPQTSLDPGDLMTCTASGTVILGQYINTATVNASHTGGSVSDSDTSWYFGTEPEITLTKTPNKLSYATAGEVITYTFVAENTGNVTLTNVAITDPLNGLSALNCDSTAPVTLASGAKLTCTATYTVTQDDVDSGKVDNIATVTAKDPVGGDVEDEDDATVNGPQADPEITLTKTPDKTTYSATGDTITYTFVAENTGNVTLTNVAITDPLSGLSALSCDKTAPVTLLPAAKLTCTATYTTDQGDIDTGKVENTATATAKDPAGSDVEDDDDATVNGPTINADITLTKTPDKTTYSAMGETITYTFVAENTGNVTLTNVGITDPLSGLSALSCDKDAPVTLLPTAKLTCTATFTTDQGDIDAGKVENTATATAKDPAGANVQDTDDATVNGPQADPEITLTKTPDKITYSATGDTITYTFVAENTGNVTLTNVVISDPLSGLSALSCDKAAPVTLLPAAKLTCTATYTTDQGDIDAGEILNTAKATGNPITGDPVEDSDGAEVTAADIEADIELTKTANPETYTAIDEVITYTFVARNTGDVTLTDVGIVDPLSGLYDWNCDLADPVTLLPGEFLTCTANYKIGQADIDRGVIENTATATGKDPSEVEINDDDDALVEGPKEEASIRLVKVANPLEFLEVGDEITYTLLAVNNGIYTLFDVTIEDSLIDSSSLECEPEQPTTLLPGESITCTAKYLVTQADLNKGYIINTATATGLDPNEEEVSDEDDAVVEGPKDDASIRLEKTAKPSTYKNVGDEITYTFVVTNDGIYTLTDVVVTDDLFGLSFGPIESLEPGESETYKYTYTITQADIDAKEIENVAAATGNDPEGNPVTTTDDEIITGPETEKVVVEPKELPTTGFAPNKLTVLPSQPADKVYATFSDFWLEIPKLGVKVDIVGVPTTDEGWDVTWLGNQAGWLYGTTFPTWPGNSTLTGHVWDAFDQAGPFVNLNQLGYGDQIIIHLNGSTYIFEVRSKYVVLPGNMNVIDQVETYSWLNLVTCKGFNEAREEYLYRLIVRAILVDVQ